MSETPDRIVVRPGLNVPDYIRSGSDRNYGCSIFEKIY
jgi:hypothetical protein